MQGVPDGSRCRCAGDAMMTQLSSHDPFSGMTHFWISMIVIDRRRSIQSTNGNDIYRHENIL